MEIGTVVPVVAVVSFGVFVLRQLIEFLRLRAQRKAAREAFLRALFAEIDLNTHDLEIFVQSFDLGLLADAFGKNADLVPHVTDVRHRDIYASNLTGVHQVGQANVSRVIEFYGLLATIREVIVGISAPTYQKISPAGKLGVLARLADDADTAARQGRLLLSALDQDHADLNLKRSAHFSKNLSLKDRKAAFASNLDRARANHQRDLSM